MKDELPDLTPYLNKKGGNSQGRGEEPAGKTDISQKLSALVKKPGTSTGTHASIDAADSSGFQEQVLAAESAAPAEAGSQNHSSAPPAPTPASSPAEDSSARWGAIARSGNPDLFATTGSDNAPSSQVPEAPQAVHSSDDGYNSSSASPSRDMARPGQPVALGQDKLKGPQAKPMSTLSSSSAPPLLKQPPKMPGRPAQPYSYKPAIEPGREAMAPKAPSSAPVNRGPQPTAAAKPAPPGGVQQPFQQQPVNPSSSMQPKAPPTQSPSQPSPQAAPQSQPPRPQAPAAPTSSSSSSSSNYSGSTNSPSSSNSSTFSTASQSGSNQSFSSQSSPRVETDAEKLARAFMEEAKALQSSAPPSTSTSSFDEPDYGESAQSSGLSSFAAASDTEAELSLKDYLEANIPAAKAPEPAPAPPVVPAPEPVAEPEPVSKSESVSKSEPVEPLLDPKPHHQETGPKSSLSSLFDSGVLNSRYEEEQPKKALGFGNLLGAPSPEVEEERNKHTTFSDLMVPTGEHDALFAPDRRDANDSAFDEVASETVDSSSMRMDDKSEAPAFSSLFSSEIVTSGSDFSNNSAPADSDLLEPASAVEESPAVSPKSLAISKLIEAVNQSESKDKIPAVSATADDTALSSFARPVEEPPAASTSDTASSDDSGQTPDLGALSPTAMEALAAFVPKAGEEQHETKGLLAKLKAKDAAAKAEAKAKAKESEVKPAEPETKSEAKADALGALLAQMDAEEVSVPEPAKPSGSLASLLSGGAPEAKEEIKAKEVEPPAPVAQVKPAPAPLPVSAPEPAAADDDDDSGNSLGDAISDALDKLLGDVEDGGAVGQSDMSPAADTAAVAPAADTAAHSSGDFASMSSGLSKLLDDDPDRFNRPIGGHMQGAEEALEAAITASAADPSVAAEVMPAEAHPLTLTNSKVDALSRLLEVASKAPEKSAEEKAREAANAQTSRQKMDSMSQQDPNQPQKEAFTSPFGGGGGTSPFAAPTNPYADGQPSSGSGNAGVSTSPFGTAINSSNSGVSMNHTPAGSFSPTSQQAPSGFTGTGSMADMPKASGIASDAVSARIAALNRKLEEQTKSTASGMAAMPPPSQQLSPQPEYQPPPPPPPMTASAPEFIPNPIVDDSPQTRAELVNRILGSAKISQTALPDLPARGAPELPMDQQLSQMTAQKGQKNSPPKSKARARGGRSGPDPRSILLVLAVLVIAGLGGYVAFQNGVFKNIDFAKGKIGDAKITVDQAIKSGDLDKAVEMLEAKKESGKFSAAESEKLNGLYYQLADKASDDNPSEAVKLLEKIPSKSKKFKDAQKLLRKIKKKAKKN